jgi:gas vesicle protein
MRSATRFLEGFVLGGLVGVVVALLFAPSSGEELRMQMQNEAARIRSEVSDAARARRAELEDQLAALRAPRQPGQPGQPGEM